MPTHETSQNPSSRDGTMLIVPREAAGNTKVSIAAVAPEAAFGPAMPANRTQKATTTVTPAAMADFASTDAGVLTAVPSTISTVPVSARPKWATSLSLRPPRKAGEDQRRKTAEGRKRGHLGVFHDMARESKKRRDYEHRPQRPESRHF